MGVSGVTVFGWAVNCPVGNHSLFNEVSLHEVLDNGLLLHKIKFVRKGNPDLPGCPAVRPSLCLFDFVPQSRSVLDPSRGVVRGLDTRIEDARLPTVVEGLSESLIGQPFARTVSDGSDCRFPGTPGNDRSV